MEKGSHQAQSIRFATFEVDLQAGELRKSGLKLKFSGQPFQVLAILLEQPGAVVTREELQKRLWPDTFVDVDHNLNTAINKIREVLCDSAENPRFVETLPRRGYRFIHPLTTATPSSLAAASRLEDSPGAIPELGVRGGIERSVGVGRSSLVDILRRWGTARAAGILLLTLGAILWTANRFGTHSREVRIEGRLTHTKITFSGNSYSPAISPDGAFVAYLTNSTGNHKDDQLMMQATSGGPSLELLHGPTMPGFRWSRDGSELAASTGTGNVVVVSRLGGTTRQLAANIEGYLCWSSDGSHIVSAMVPHDSGIWMIDKVTGSSRRISSPPYTWLEDIDCSPKKGGELLILSITSGTYQIWTMKLDGTDQHEVLEEHNRIKSPRWSPMEDAIYYFLSKGETDELLKLKIASQPAAPSVLVSGLETGQWARFTTSADGSQLAYERAASSSNLWSIDLPARGIAATVRQKALTSGTSSDLYPSISPDSRWVAFVSAGNIFKMPIEGGQPVQLTSFDVVKSTSPVWSSDGQKIAFVCDRGGAAKVWTVRADGGDARSFDKTNASDTNFQLAWLTRSEILYQPSGMHNIRRLNIETESDQPLLSADSEGVLISRPILSPDGQKIAIFWLRPHADGLWVITLDKYSEEFLHKDLLPFGWSPDGAFIYAYKAGTREIVRIGVKDSKQPDSIISVPGFLSFSSVAISPDGKKIIAAEDQGVSDIWLMRNFEPQPAR